MSNTNVVEDIVRAVVCERTARTRLQEELAAQTRSEREARERAARRDRRSVIKSDRILRLRTEKAYQGLMNLRALAQTQECREFIALKGGSFRLWGSVYSCTPGHDMSDLHFKWTAKILLTETRIIIGCYTEDSNDYGGTFRIDPRIEGDPAPVIAFPHDLDDAWIIKSTLQGFATTSPYEEAQWKKHYDPNDDLSFEHIFEILVECSDERMVDHMTRIAAGLPYADDEEASSDDVLDA